MIKNTVILNKSQIEELITMEDAVEYAFAQDALLNVQMPAKKYIYSNNEETDSKGDLRIMPCFINGTCAAGVKCVNVHPDNPIKHNLPTVMAVIELVDPDTGFPIAIMDGTSVTNMRTEAATGVATKYMAKEAAETCGFVGSGAQALLAFTALNEVREIKELKIASKCMDTCNDLVSMITENMGSMQRQLTAQEKL
jgi:alanine dehydrogenase